MTAANLRSTGNFRSAKAPLLSRGGVAATSTRCREASFDGADEVVLVKKTNLFTNTTPSARAMVASHVFVTPRIHPSSAEEGSFAHSLCLTRL